MGEVESKRKIQAVRSKEEEKKAKRGERGIKRDIQREKARNSKKAGCPRPLPLLSVASR